jgi:non-heme chloroperoxidase
MFVTLVRDAGEALERGPRGQRPKASAVRQLPGKEMDMARDVPVAELPTGVKLPYVEQGDPSGVPLLLVPGYTGSWRAFEPILPFLSTSIHTFAITLRGHGGASRPQEGYTIPDFAADLVALRDVHELEAAVLAGGSSGGLIARRVAIDHPVRTLGLVFLGSPRTPRGNVEVKKMSDEDVSEMTDPVDPEFVRDFLEPTVDRPVPPDRMDAMVQESLMVPARVWGATLKGLLEDDSVDELHKIKAPTLIIWSDRDSLLPREDEEALAAAIPGAQFVVYRGAGHVFYWEEPERVAADLVSFVEGLHG